MFRPAVFTTVALAAIAAAGVATSQSNTPTRKAGWWDISVKTIGITTKVQVCTDAAVEKVYPSMAGNPGDQCSPAIVRQTAQGWSFETTCNANGTQAKTSGTATGDFQSSYHVDAITQVPNMPIPALGKIATTIDGRYLGACPAPRKPGEMVMGGRVTDLLKAR